MYLMMKGTEGKLTITGPRDLMTRFAEYMGYDLALLEAVVTDFQAREAEKGVSS